MQSHSISSPQEFWLGCMQPRVACIRKMRSLDKFDGIARAHRMIDDEFAAIHTAMCALHTERNALTPVCRLPSETLSRIFLYCAQMDDWDPECDPPPYPCWLAVTHVCKYWRETALHYPQLWTDIPGNLNAHWVEVVLARGKSGPFSISAHDTPVIAALAAIRDRLTISCIRDIYLYTKDHNILMPILKLMVPSSADALQCLDLALGDDNGRDIRFPEYIFRGHTPMLHTISLRNIYIPWSAPIFCNLKHLDAIATYPHALSIAVDPSDSGSSTSCDCLLDALRGMPALVTLHLVHRLPSKGDDGIVELPHLRSLYLQDGTNRCSYVVKHLVIPSSCILTLFCEDGIQAQFINEVASFFHAHVNRAQTPLQMLRLSVDDKHSWFRSSRIITDGPPLHTLALPHRDPDGTTSIPWDAVATLCDRFPMGSIRHLNIWSSTRYTMNGAEYLAIQSHDVLLETLRRMPVLERLEIVDSARCLLYRSRHSVDESIVDLPCLKFLRVEATTTQCLNLIKCLKVPSSCDIKLVCSGEDIEAQSKIPEVMFLFHAHVNRECQAPLQSLVLTVDHEDFSVRTSRRSDDGETIISYHLQLPHLETDRTSTTPDLQVHRFRYPQPSRDNVAALCHGLPLEGISQLKLKLSNHDLKGWAPREWLGILGRYGAVEYVQFQGNILMASVFCRALAMHINKEGNLFLQNLCHLTLNINDWYRDPDQACETIVDRVDARQKVKRIQTIGIIDDPSDPEWFITDLKNIGPEVQEVGRQDWHSDSD